MSLSLGFRHALIIAAAVGLMGANASAESAKPAVKSDDIRVQLAKRLPGAKPEDVRPSPINGMYEISLGGSIAYISSDGKYLITGDMYEIASKTNLTDEHRAEVRQRVLATVKDADTIIFAPVAPAKYTLTVFTDTDCGYCRKLHSEIAELNKLGIRVRYAAYPRGGPGSDSWATMESVWCSKDRRAALTKAKLGEEIATVKCGTTPVATQFRLGSEMGINGTPAIFTENGEMIGGYMAPQKLAAYLDEIKAQQAVAASKGGG
jgi:thiol:disulfide interchange protein DsbC